jgi:hypothetical protein
VPAAVVVAGVLQVVWATSMATGGGDLAAQDAWALFARVHPGSAYDLWWYGGMHPVSYSVLSPYVMAWVGVRTTMVVVSTATAGVLAWLLERSGRVRHPVVPALYAAVALFANSVSGRVTFAMGVLGAVVAVSLLLVDRPDSTRRVTWPRVGAALAGAMATAMSPVAGLFLGLMAAATWLRGRRAQALFVGVPPVVVVLGSAALFPFAGQQPMRWISAILPLIMAGTVFALVPTSWRTARVVAVVYAAAVLYAWWVPSPIGTNVVRLPLLFGGVVLLAALTSDAGRTSWWAARDRWVPARLLLVLAIITVTIWQGAVAGLDAFHSRAPESGQSALPSLVAQLRARDADLGRVEVVPTRSHAEAAALAPHVNLARGWNRQADADRNPIFYRQRPLTSRAYHAWLRRWAVGYVVLSSAAADPAAVEEQELVASHPPYLRQVWSAGGWTLFRVQDSRPLVEPPARVSAFDAATVTVRTPGPGNFTVRVPYSPWLALVDADGRALADDPAGACLSPQSTEQPEPQSRPEWLVLHAPAAGTYRISAPYTLPRGSACL